MIKTAEERLKVYISLLIASKRVFKTQPQQKKFIIGDMTEKRFSVRKANDVNYELRSVSFKHMIDMVKIYNHRRSNDKKYYKEAGYQHLSYSTQLLPDFFNYLEECNFDELIVQENIPTAIEGKRRLVESYVLSRNPKLVEEAKIRDKYTCQACGYHKSINGVFIIDCHHITPISLTGERVTKINELVCLCPNCHRIAHSKMPPLNLDEIKKL